MSERIASHSPASRKSASTSLTCPRAARSSAARTLAVRRSARGRRLDRAERLGEGRAAAAKMLAQKHEGSDPTLGLLLDALQLLCLEMPAPEDRLGFLGRAAELRGVEAGDTATRDEPSELGRRIGAR